MANPWQHLKEHRKPANMPRSGGTDSARAEIDTGFDVQKYTINISISQDPNHISGNVLAEVYAEDNLTEIVYDLIGLNVSEVRVNNAVVPYTHDQGLIHIPLAVSAGETFTTQVFYSGSPQLSGAPYNVGMYFRPNSIFTVSDPNAGRFWWPSYDHPWDKAVIDLIITMRSDWKVAANGIRESIVNNGDGTATTTWRGEHPMTTYLVCLTAGNYQEIPQTALQGELPIMNFVSPGQYNTLFRPRFPTGYDRLLLRAIW
jgi:aminopeptidase N